MQGTERTPPQGCSWDRTMNFKVHTVLLPLSRVYSKNKYSAMYSLPKSTETLVTFCSLHKHSGCKLFSNIIWSLHFFFFRLRIREHFFDITALCISICVGNSRACFKITNVAVDGHYVNLDHFAKELVGAHALQHVSLEFETRLGPLRLANH